MKLKSIKQVHKERQKSEKFIKDFIIDNFDKYDANRNGKLSEEELRVFFGEIIKRKGLEKEYDAHNLAVRFISYIDIDGDEQLSMEEIYRYYKEK